MSARLKMGVIGLSRMGQLYVRMLATQVSGVHLYAIAEVDRQAQTQMANELSVPPTFADAYDLIALPELDAVVITTPTRTHYDLVISAASAGKAIFCEKPLALTLEETRTALEAVARAQVLLQVGFMRRFDAGYQHTPVVLFTRAGAQHDVTPYLMERFGDAYGAQLQHFVDCLNSGQSPSVSGADALAACEIGIAATRAYQTGRPVALSELQRSAGESNR